MPQLDKLILLLEFKIFIVFFLGTYLLSLVFILSKINLNLRIRRLKVRNLFQVSCVLKSLRFIFSRKMKNFFSADFLIYEKSIPILPDLSKNNLYSHSIIAVSSIFDNM